MQQQVPVSSPPAQPRIITVNNPDGTAIPVRFFCKEARHYPVLLFHGLQSHSGWFIRTAVQLAAHGFPVYAFDRRGSGLSVEPRGVCRSFEDILSDANAVAEHAMNVHGAQAVHSVGFCFGSMPATLFALRQALPCQSLVLSSPAIYTKVRPTVAQMFVAGTKRLLRKPGLVPVPYEQAELSELPRYQKAIQGDKLSLVQTDMQVHFEVLKMRREIAKTIATLRVPLLALFAEQDSITDNAAVMRLLRKLPKEQTVLLEYPQARHILEYSGARRAYLADLMSWMSTTESGKNKPVRLADQKVR